ncbi:GNAT family N-acetyltransferase [Jeotgalibacillus proteolyticus]|uniref:GNAT family N-acetyltransferase n=1 Tax=Jeotgalibacillus proteolyticus TaxID=2082395 RepID=UPI003CED8ECA
MLRLYQENDEQKINELFLTVFNKKRSIEEWQWKFSNSLKHDPIIAIYEENGSILGHAAVLVFEGKTGSNDALFGERIDVMVHPDYRGKGIYQQLITFLIDQCKEKEIHFVYGYPAPKAKELFIRYMNGKEITYVPRLLSILSPGKLLLSRVKPLRKVHFLFSWLDRAFKMRSKVSREIKVEEINVIDERFDLLWNRISSDYSMLIKRSSEYLSWRYKEHPNRDYRLYMVFRGDEAIGYIAIRDEIIKKNNYSLNMLHVTDLFCLNNSYDSLEMVKALNSVAGHADIVSTWSLLHTEQYKALKKKGRFLHIGNPMPLVGKMLFEETSPLDPYDSSQWFVSQGDVDSY